MDAKIYTFEVDTNDGCSLMLSNYRGKVLLIVNVASKCGFTPQYEGLQKLYEKYREQGLTILAFPSNDFAGQEPASDKDISSFCREKFQITFDLFSKVSVLGPQTLPLYQYLYDCQLVPKGEDGFRSKMFGLVKWVLYRIKGEHVPGKNEAQWNFHKFLVGKNGVPVASFLSEVAPDSKLLIEQLEVELGK